MRVFVRVLVVFALGLATGISLAVSFQALEQGCRFVLYGVSVVPSPAIKSGCVELSKYAVTCND
jgi:hypothetical protein